MGPFELLEKLINEHGSATVLREHIGLLKAQQAALESRCRDAETKNAELQRSLAEYKARAEKAEKALQALQTGAVGTLVCDHCGAIDLQRVGSRPQPTFGALGVKEAIYRCRACGCDTFVEIPLT